MILKIIVNLFNSVDGLMIPFQSFNGGSSGHSDCLFIHCENGFS